MRVGVFLGDYSPEDGGGYVFVSKVFGAFLELAHTSNHQFLVFCEPTQIKVLSARPAARNVRFYGVRKNNWFDKAIGALKHYSPLFALLYRRPSRFARAALESAVELIWFVGGADYDASEIPYVATVWDLQHRTHPWFPEVSRGGRWDYRDLTWARFLRRATYVITGTEAGREQ